MSEEGKRNSKTTFFGQRMNLPSGDVCLEKFKNVLE
jgi:hypothetical protein